MDSRPHATDDNDLTQALIPPDTAIFCHGVVLNGTLHRNVVMRSEQTSGRITLTPITRETHSTTVYEGAAVILPAHAMDIPLPAAIPTAAFTDTLSALLPGLPHCNDDERCIVRFIPLS